MAKRIKRGVLRRDATPINVYNEGLAVYLYDEANSSRLKDLLRKHRLKQDFFNTLEQDDPIAVPVSTKDLYQFRRDCTAK
jgi:hypothetical protein